MKKHFLIFLLIVIPYFIYANEAYDFEMTVNVGDGVSNLKILQNYKNDSFVFYLQDNCIKELKSNKNVCVLYDSNDLIKSFEICETIFGPAIIIIEENHNFKKLNCLILNSNMEVVKFLILEENVESIKDITIQDFQDRFEIFAIKNGALINYTINNTDDVSSICFSHNIDSYKIYKKNNTIEGYITENGKTTFFVKDEFLKTIDFYDINCIYDVNNLMLCEDNTKYIIKNNIGYFLLKLKYDDKQNQFDLLNIYTDSDFENIELLESYNSENNLILLFKRNDQLYIRFYDSVNNFIEQKISNNSENFYICPFKNDEFILSVGKENKLFYILNIFEKSIINIDNPENIYFTFYSIIIDTESKIFGILDNGSIGFFEIKNNAIVTKKIEFKNTNLISIDDIKELIVATKTDSNKKIILIYDNYFVFFKNDQEYVKIGNTCIKTDYVNECMYVVVLDGTNLNIFKF